jgi:hypothetical protein
MPSPRPEMQSDHENKLTTFAEFLGRTLDIQPPNKSTSFSPLTLGSNQSLSSNFLTSVRNSGGKFFGTS